jgi:hypothetical protein
MVVGARERALKLQQFEAQQWPATELWVGQCLSSASVWSVDQLESALREVSASRWAGLPAELDDARRRLESALRVRIDRLNAELALL